MNDFELNGRLLEISIALDCNILDLIFIKDQIEKTGFHAVNKEQLRNLGFPLKQNTFEECVKEMSDDFGIISKHRINSLGFVLGKKQDEINNLLSKLN